MKVLRKMLFLITLRQIQSWKKIHYISNPYTTLLNEQVIYSKIDESSTWKETPKSYPPIFLRAMDIQCGNGESTFYLKNLLKTICVPMDSYKLEVIGLDTDLKKLHEATYKYPNIEFLYYDFFRYADVDIRPKGLDVIQSSIDKLTSNLEMHTYKMDYALHDQGSLHLYGNLSMNINWNSYGIDCSLRIPYSQHQEYFILQKIHKNGFKEGLPSLLTKYNYGT